MPHIHKLHDFVISVFIVHRFKGPSKYSLAGKKPAPRKTIGTDKVLLVYHKKYREWLPIGGHIELSEDPLHALYREIREECALNVRILTKAPAIGHKGVKPLPAPSFVDVHRISQTHKHIAFVYFGVSRDSRVRLHHREHREFRWVSKPHLKDPKLGLTRSIRFYCCQALKAARSL